MGTQVALSLCEGNTMGPHIVGDLVSVLLAMAQAPWLCHAPCTFWTTAASTAWLAARVRLPLQNHRPQACKIGGIRWSAWTAVLDH